MALKAYFDGATGFITENGKRSPKSLTLTCLAADEQIWSQLEPEWEKVRKERGNPPFLHMADAMSLNGDIFGSWDEQRRDYLLDGLYSVLHGFGKNPRMHSFTCTIDLQAHARWKAIKNHPSPARLCTRYVCPVMFEWYARFPDPILSAMELYFDSGEPFMRHVDADWKNKKMKKEYPALEIIRTIAPVNMKITPPIQMADMICWGFSRQSVVEISAENVAAEYAYHTRAVTCANAVDGIWMEAREEELSKYKYPPEGSEQYMRQYRSARL